MNRLVRQFSAHPSLVGRTVHKLLPTHELDHVQELRERETVYEKINRLFTVRLKWRKTQSVVSLRVYLSVAVSLNTCSKSERLIFYIALLKSLKKSNSFLLPSPGSSPLSFRRFARISHCGIRKPCDSFSLSGGS